MYYKKNIILFLTFISYFYSTFSVSIENSEFLNYKINVSLKKVNKVSIKSLLDDKIINGSIEGTIDSSAHNNFSNANFPLATFSNDDKRLATLLIAFCDFKVSVGNTLNVFAIDEALRISRLKWPPLVL